VSPISAFKDQRVHVQIKILVVEDNRDTREMLVTLLEQEGFSVIEAEDGRAGLAQAIDDGPDLILTDLHMSGLTGIDLIRRLRTQPRLEGLPILVLTASPDLADDATLAGANYVLIKPVSLDTLIGHVRRLLLARENPRGK
jgi:CheY-like chemotaxis protein